MEHLIGRARDNIVLREARKGGPRGLIMEQRADGSELSKVWKNDDYELDEYDLCIYCTIF